MYHHWVECGLPVGASYLEGSTCSWCGIVILARLHGLHMCRLCTGLTEISKYTFAVHSPVSADVVILSHRPIYIQLFRAIGLSERLDLLFLSITITAGPSICQRFTCFNSDMSLIPSTDQQGLFYTCMKLLRPQKSSLEKRLFLNI